MGKSIMFAAGVLAAGALTACSGKAQEEILSIEPTRII